MKIYTLLFFCTAIAFFSSCKKDGVDVTHLYYENKDYELISSKVNLPKEALDYDIKFPNHAPFRGSTYNRDMATLGRVLFYDTNLSSDRSISCASCHKQQIGFSDDVPFSKGVGSHHTNRNSLALGSVFNFQVYYGDPDFGLVPFFWDNRAFDSQSQASQTLKNNKEMGMNDDLIADRIREQSFYEPLIEKAFNKELDEVTSDEVVQAISIFINSMGSFNSKFDQAYDEFLSHSNNDSDDIGTKEFALFTPIENQGKNIYVAHCGSCHGEQHHTPDEIAANNGLATSYSDNGVGKLTYNVSEMGFFKVPTLRNISLTAPYMHDGSISSLPEVIEHYSTGIVNHPNLSEALKDEDGNPRQFNFTQEEKEALLSFLNTLTDNDFITAERYADPFK